MFYLLVAISSTRRALHRRPEGRGIQAVFHYVPLHSSAAGRRFGRAATAMPHTDAISGRLVRLPLWVGMTASDVDTVGGCVERILA